MTTFNLYKDGELLGSYPNRGEALRGLTTELSNTILLGYCGNFRKLKDTPDGFSYYGRTGDEVASRIHRVWIQQQSQRCSLS